MNYFQNLQRRSLLDGFKLTVCLLALAFVMLGTGCSKKKKQSDAPIPPPAAPAPAPPATAPPVQANPDDVQAAAERQEPDDGETEYEEPDDDLDGPPPAGTSVKVPVTIKTKKGPKKRPERKVKVEVPVKDATVTIHNEKGKKGRGSRSTIVEFNYDNADKDLVERTLTGAKNSLDMRYTDSSTDQLLKNLKQVWRGQKDFGRRTRDKRLAARLQAVKIKTETPNGMVEVKFQVIGNPTTQTYCLQGKLTSDGTAILKPGGSDPKCLNKTQPVFELVGNLQCMDFDGGCNNVSLEIIEMFTGGPIANAFVIYRVTPAALKYYIEDINSLNRSYQEWITYLDNSVNRTYLIDSIDDVEFVTSTVVGGKSEFYVFMYGLGTTAFRGPLVLGNFGARFGKPIRIDQLPSPELRSNYNSSIEKIELVGNDGQGQILLYVTIAEDMGAAAELLTFLIKRRPIPIKD